MDAPVHAADHEAHPVAHLVAVQALVEHLADDALGRVLPVQDVARKRTRLGQAFSLQGPVHALDDVAALAELAQDGFGPT